MATGNHEVTQPGLEVTSDPSFFAPSGPPSGPNALFGLLRADRSEVERLLRRLECTSASDPARALLWASLSSILICHCQAEEDALYRLMSRMPATFDVAECSIEEHDLITGLVERVDALPRTDDDDFDIALADLRVAIDRHLDDEDRELLPLVAEMFDSDEITRLAERFVRLKHKYQVPVQSRAEALNSMSGTFETWPPDALYELALIRRIKGRGRMGRVELIQALRRFGS